MRVLFIFFDRSTRKYWDKIHQFSSADTYVQYLKNNPWSRFGIPVYMIVMGLLGMLFIATGCAGWRYPGWAYDVITSASLVR